MCVLLKGVNVLVTLLQACSEVVQYVCECYRVIHDSLDGKNREAVLMEFGTRLHRAIYEHIQQFTFNSTG